MTAIADAARLRPAHLAPSPLARPAAAGTGSTCPAPLSAAFRARCCGPGALRLRLWGGPALGASSPSVPRRDSPTMHRAPNGQHQPDITRGPPPPNRARPGSAPPPPAPAWGPAPPPLGTARPAHGAGHCSAPEHGMLGTAAAWGWTRHSAALGAGPARGCSAPAPAPAPLHNHEHWQDGDWCKARVCAGGISTGTTSCMVQGLGPAPPACGWALPSPRTGTSTGTVCTGPGAAIGLGSAFWSWDCLTRTVPLGLELPAALSVWSWAQHCWDQGRIQHICLGLGIAVQLHWNLQHHQHGAGTVLSWQWSQPQQWWPRVFFYSSVLGPGPALGTPARDWFTTLHCQCQHRRWHSLS